MSGNGSTLISELGSIRDKDQPDQSEVDALLREIETSGNNNNTEEVEDHVADEPSSDDMEAAMRMVSQVPNVRRAAHTALKNRGRRAPPKQRYEDDDYIPERPATRGSSSSRGPTTRQLIVQHLHLPIIIALAVVVAFASPLSDTIGTWIPSAAGAVYNGALQPVGLYVRAALVGLMIAIYKYFVSSVFPSIPL